MSVVPITLVPNEVLRAKSKDVILDKKTLDAIANLSDTLMAKTDPKGVGLSAPQLGKNWNLFVTWLASNVEDDPTPGDMKIFMNPVIIGHSAETTYGPDPDDPILEGCLSIPGLYGPVPRWEWVEVQYQTPDTNAQILEKTARLSDFEARVFQHEYDHLQGVLFTDYSLKHDLPIYEFVGKKMNEINKELVKAF